MALVTALAELDEFSADAHCMQALTSAAERLTGVLHAGRHIPVHCLCQVGFLHISMRHQMAMCSINVTISSCFCTCMLPGSFLPWANVTKLTWDMQRLLQVVAAVAMSRTLQKSFKPLMNMCITALEPQLDRCRCALHTALCATPFHDCIWQSQGCRCAVWAFVSSLDLCCGPALGGRQPPGRSPCISSAITDSLLCCLLRLILTCPT